MAKLNDDELLEALGVEIDAPKTSNRSPREERIIAGFEEVVTFYEDHGRAPTHDEKADVFERLCAVRLDQLRKLPEAITLLAERDSYGLLSSSSVSRLNVDELDEDALMAELGVEIGPSDDEDITVLRHVRSHAEIRASEEIANRTPCEDFERFQPLFEDAKLGLTNGRWITKPFVKNASIELGDFFVIGGQVAYVAELYEGTTTKDGRDNPRLRVIFDNRTESNLLLRSLSRSLYPDGNTPVGRRLIKCDDGPLFSGTAEPEDIEVGTIYVLRSLSSDPFVAKHRELLHKIGVTGGPVEIRIAGAEKDATYLLAGVEVVATYKLHNLNRTKLENVFHRLFKSAQLDVTISDRFGNPVKPREWFLVPLNVIDDAVQRIVDGSISNFEYDPKLARLVLDKRNKTVCK